MLIKLDENLPASLVNALGEFGHDVHTVHQEGYKGLADSYLWEHVQAEKRFFITQDLDFSDRRFDLRNSTATATQYYATSFAAGSPGASGGTETHAPA
jgi:predicted nuclease of predicted toxin-antitoxin system